MDNIYFRIQIHHDVSAQNIVDTFINAFEGCSSYWIDLLEYHIDGGDRENYDLLKEEYECPGYGIIWLLPNSWADIYVDGEPDTVRLDGSRAYTKIQRFADKHTPTLRRIINEEADAEDADVFLQEWVLGDVVFG